MFKDVVAEVTPHRWYLRPNALYPDARPYIDWQRVIPPDIGTKHQRHYLLQSVKGFITALIEMPSSKRYHTLSHATILNWVRWTRRLIDWMTRRGIWRFSALSGGDVVSFLEERSRAVSDGRPLRHSCVFVILIQWLWDLRHDYCASLKVNPATLEYDIALIVRPRERGRWKPLDEHVALPLVHDAIKWLDDYGPIVSEALVGVQLALQRSVGLRPFQLKERIRQEFESFERDPSIIELRDATDTHGQPIFRTLREGLLQTEGACLIILLFLVGLRASELASLNEDALQYVDMEGDRYPLYRIKGISAKKNGLERTWVASQPVRDVIEYVRSLHGPTRERHGLRALFLTRPGNSLISLRSAKRLSTQSLSKRIARFAQAKHRAGSPKVEKLHPHAARKTFARFVMLRDKNALESLAYHYGHTHRLITDGSYVGSDIALAELLAEETRRDLSESLTDLLRAGVLGGRAGQQFDEVRRSSNAATWRGKRGFQALVDRLIEQGVQLAPCDWGYCIYSQPVSACHGSTSGPNAALRSPEVCAGCPNFAVTEKHRRWWTSRAEREQLFLSQKALPEQTRMLVQRRLESSYRMLAVLNERARSHGESGEDQPDGTSNDTRES